MSGPALCEGLEQEYRRAQARADAVAQAFGDSAGAPRWLDGETLPQYRRRLARSYQRFSPALKGADLSKVADPATFNAVEEQIYADAAREARYPTTSLKRGELREVFETDRTGRRITRFVGDPEACWGQFKLPTKRVTGFNTGGTRA